MLLVRMLHNTTTLNITSCGYHDSITTLMRAPLPFSLTSRAQCCIPATKKFTELQLSLRVVAPFHTHWIPCRQVGPEHMYGYMHHIDDRSYMISTIVYNDNRIRDDEKGRECKVGRRPLQGSLHTMSLSDSGPLSYKFICHFSH